VQQTKSVPPVAGRFAAQNILKDNVYDISKSIRSRPLEISLAHWILLFFPSPLFPSPLFPPPLFPPPLFLPPGRGTAGRGAVGSGQRHGLINYIDTKAKMSSSRKTDLQKDFATGVYQSL
jgi:hypothetical protein